MEANLGSNLRSIITCSDCGIVTRQSTKQLHISKLPDIAPIFNGNKCVFVREVILLSDLNVERGSISSRNGEWMTIHPIFGTLTVHGDRDEIVVIIDDEEQNDFGVESTNKLNMINKLILKIG